MTHRERIAHWLMAHPRLYRLPGAPLLYNLAVRRLRLTDEDELQRLIERLRAMPQMDEKDEVD